MRILTIASGKGGVGKTSFAINFALALSKEGKTILIDLDTSTSSIRNSVDIPIKNDLYHFFRKGAALSQCITPLDSKTDPRNRFPNFGVIAGPLGLIEEISNLDQSKRNRLIDAINGLDAKYVVLDLKAGLDHNVLDFLPYSNTGILLFTPHLSASTIAASEMVKALLMRKLRIIFAHDSPLYKQIGLSDGFAGAINHMINKVEDVYDPEFENLDSFLVWLHKKLGKHRIVQLMVNTIEYFRTYFVLNMFNETNESYEKAVKPFVENIVKNISSRISINNLGWIINSPKMNLSNNHRIPLLMYDDFIKQPEANPMMKKIDDFWKGLQTEKNGKGEIPREYIKSNPETQLNQQLDLIKSIYTQTKELTIEQNFEYIFQRASYLLQGRRISDFGDSRLFKESEILDILFQRGG